MTGPTLPPVIWAVSTTTIRFAGIASPNSAFEAACASSATISRVTPRRRSTSAGTSVAVIDASRTIAPVGTELVDTTPVVWSAEA